MKKLVGSLLKQCGVTMTVTRASGEESVKGIFQPVRSKSFQSMVSLDTPLGEVPRGQYVYIGPAEVAVEDGDTLQVGGTYYIFRRVEPFYCGEDIVYLWGLCVEKGVNDTWGATS